MGNIIADSVRAPCLVEESKKKRGKKYQGSVSKNSYMKTNIFSKKPWEEAPFT